jgi:hypothetical protein
MILDWTHRTIWVSPWRIASFHVLKTGLPLALRTPDTLAFVTVIGLSALGDSLREAFGTQGRSPGRRLTMFELRTFVFPKCRNEIGATHPTRGTYLNFPS